MPRLVTPTPATTLLQPLLLPVPLSLLLSLHQDLQVLPAILVYHRQPVRSVGCLPIDGACSLSLATDCGCWHLPDSCAAFNECLCIHDRLFAGHKVVSKLKSKQIRSASHPAQVSLGEVVVTTDCQGMTQNTSQVRSRGI